MTPALRPILPVHGWLWEGAYLSRGRRQMAPSAACMTKMMKTRMTTTKQQLSSCRFSQFVHLVSCRWTLPLCWQQPKLCLHSWRLWWPSPATLVARWKHLISCENSFKELLFVSFLYHGIVSIFPYRSKKRRWMLGCPESHRFPEHHQEMILNLERFS